MTKVRYWYWCARTSHGLRNLNGGQTFQDRTASPGPNPPGPNHPDRIPPQGGHTAFWLSRQPLLSSRLFARAYPLVRQGIPLTCSPARVCLSADPPACPPARVCLSADPPAHLTGFRPAYAADRYCPSPSVDLPKLMVSDQPASLPVHQSVCMSASQSACPSTRLHVRQPVCLQKHRLPFVLLSPIRYRANPLCAYQDHSASPPTCPPSNRPIRPQCNPLA